MATYRHVESSQFLGFTLWPAAILCALILVIVNIGSCMKQETAEANKYKHAFYAALQQKEPKHDVPDAVRFATAIRPVLPNEEQWTLLVAQRVIREKTDNNGWSGYQERAKQALPTAVPLLELADDSGWSKFSEEEQKHFLAVAEGRTEIPAMETEVTPQKIPWKTILPTIQFVSFFIYMWKRAFEDDGRRWYHLAWGTPGITLVFLALLPGAAPLMLLALIADLLSTDFLAFVQGRKKRREERSRVLQTEHDFDSGTKDTQELALRLRGRLAEREG